MSFSSWKPSVTPRSVNYAPISDTSTESMGAPPTPGLWWRNTYTIILLLLDVALIWVSRLFTLELCYNTTAPYFFFLLFFSFILFFYRGQGTFIGFNFIALGNAIESAAWSIIGNWLARSYLRNAERLFPWRGIINKVLCGKAPPLSS